MQQLPDKKYDPFVDIVIGMSDGLAIPFAVATGMAAVVADTYKIGIAAFVATTVMGVVMGVSGYMTSREGLHDDGHHHHHGEDEVESQFDHHHHHKDAVRDEAAEAIRRQEMELQLQMHKADAADARRSALYIAVFSIIGGLITIVPYFLVQPGTEALKWAAIITTLALILFGSIKAKLTGRNIIWGAVYVTGRGLLLAGSSYLVATIFA